MSQYSNSQYNFELEFNPYNFYSATNKQDLPKEMVCKVLAEESNELNCSDDANLQKCYNHELCKNKDLVNNMYLRRNDHYAAEESYANMLTKYNFSVLKSVNLAAGIVGSLVFIYYHK
jgi:hypothetical protein